MNVTFYGKKKLSDVLKLEDLEMGRLSLVYVYGPEVNITLDKADAGAELAETAMGWQRQNWSDVL